MPLPFPRIISGDAVAVDDSGAVAGYQAAMPLTTVGVATVPSTPTSYGPGGIPVSGGRVAYASAPVAYVSNGTPYTATHAIAFGAGPVAYYDQGMPYNAAGQLIVQNAGAPDATPPSAPGTLTATAISATQVDLAWGAATDNVAVTGYRVERCTGAACVNFVEIAQPTGLTFSDTGRAANTIYRYQVRAADAVPNLGPYSNIAQATTPAPPITPADLFLAGELGCWLDPSDLSSLWQDSAGTVPVTGVGQPVGKITDKSGRNLHFTQSTAANQAKLQQDAGGRYYLDFDGVDDGYFTGATNFTAANGKVTIWAGVNMLQNGASSAGTIIEFSAASGSNLNCFALQGPAGDLNGYFWRSRGSGGGDGTVDLTAPVPPATNVVCTIGDVAGDISTIRVDSVATTVNIDQGTGGYATYPFYLGRRGGTTLPFKGRMYGVIMRGTVTTTPQQIVDIERWMAAKTGITLP